MWAGGCVVSRAVAGVRLLTRRSGCSLIAPQLARTRRAYCTCMKHQALWNDLPRLQAGSRHVPTRWCSCFPQPCLARTPALARLCTRTRWKQPAWRICITHACACLHMTPASYRAPCEGASTPDDQGWSRGLLC